MSRSKAIGSFNNVREALDKALSSEHGIRIRVETKGLGISLRQRMYSFRKLDREQNKKVYAEGDPLHGVSVYDDLIVLVEYPYVIVKRPAPIAVEELTEDEA